ncbi:hypothetical protein M9H77_19483 [Catharanthus roseus]|uniref:Uncharacterized protein n=1 Tax=Catharanthus roseus TaxID=4058 RepID=A0ACC0BAF7_CATRO|nr:hypothetical protein M9H77_19483 [Catharanthus roseus]
MDFDNPFLPETFCPIFYSVDCSCLEDRMLNYKEHISKSPRAQPDKNWIDMFICKFPPNIYPAHKHLVLYRFLYILQEHENKVINTCVYLATTTLAYGTGGAPKPSIVIRSYAADIAAGDAERPKKRCKPLKGLREQFAQASISFDDICNLLGGEPSVQERGLVPTQILSAPFHRYLRWPDLTILILQLILPCQEGMLVKCIKGISWFKR